MRKKNKTKQKSQEQQKVIVETKLRNYSHKRRHWEGIYTFIVISTQWKSQQQASGAFGKWEIRLHRPHQCHPNKFNSKKSHRSLYFRIKDSCSKVRDGQHLMNLVKSKAVLGDGLDLSLSFMKLKWSSLLLNAQGGSPACEMDSVNYVQPKGDFLQCCVCWRSLGRKITVWDGPSSPQSSLGWDAFSYWAPPCGISGSHM